MSPDLMQKTTVVVSGANGFIGRAVCAALTSRGYLVRGLVRDPARVPEALGDVEWHVWDLGGPLPAGVLGGCKVKNVVHCAYDLEPGAYQRNLKGSLALHDAALAAGAERFVFVSSFSAHEKAESEYGRSKWAIEQRLDRSRSAIVRPGFVVGRGGVCLRLAQSITSVPFIPIFFGGDQSIQTIDLDDLVEGIARIVDQHLVGLFCLAEEEPVGLRAFYAELAKCQGARPRFVRLSGRASLLALRAVEKMGIRPSMTSENLLGLKNLRTIDVRSNLRELGLAPRAMRDSVKHYYG